MMEPPHDPSLPFFAYGLFKPGQLAYFQLRELVALVPQPETVKGDLYVRDGLPILDLEGVGLLDGALLTFPPGKTAEAYARISAMEPDKHYVWRETHVNGHRVNILAGIVARKGSRPCDGADWDGWDDPLFGSALAVVEETLVGQEFNWTDLKPLFRLQMAYLLLWSSIERYLSLRYHLGDRVMMKVGNLAEEVAFADGLRRYVSGTRQVFRADRPGDRLILDANTPSKSVLYYYQVRSNITHRGKGLPNDFEMLKSSLSELLPIFRHVLDVAKLESRGVV